MPTKQYKLTITGYDSLGMKVYKYKLRNEANDVMSRGQSFGFWSILDAATEAVTTWYEKKPQQVNLQEQVIAHMQNYFELVKEAEDNKEAEPNPEWMNGYQAAMAIARQLVSRAGQL